MVLFRILFAIILCVSIIAVAFSKINHRDYRYRIGAGPCLNYLTSRSPQHVNLAGIGGSRMLALMMPDEVIAASKELLSNEIEVMNYAKSWFGPDFELQLLEDIYGKGIKIEHLLVQLEAQRPGPFHPHAYSFLTSRNLLNAGFHSGLKSSLEGWQFLSQSHMKKIRDLAFNTGEKKFNRFNNLKKKDPRTCYPKDYIVDQKVVEKSKLKFRKRGLREVDFDISEANFYYSKAHYQKIIDLAEKNGTQVSLILIPRFDSPIINDISTKNIEEFFGVKLIQLPLSLREQLVENGYRDGSHLHSPGRDLVLPWLLKQIYTEH